MQQPIDYELGELAILGNHGRSEYRKLSGRKDGGMTLRRVLFRRTCMFWVRLRADKSQPLQRVPTGLLLFVIPGAKFRVSAGPPTVSSLPDAPARANEGQ